VNAPDAAVDTDGTLLALAGRLVESTGRGGVTTVVRLTGGRNNQVYRVELDDGGSLLLKRYFSDPRDPRDRLGAEWNFLQHAWSRGIRVVPEPLACDASLQAGLYGYVNGRKLAAAELEPRHVDAAIEFILAVNARPRAALAPASEACFSLT